MIIFFISNVQSLNEIQIASSKSWCWTKPIINDPSFVLNENNGGINWGFCVPSKETIKKKKAYLVSIMTSNLPGSETSSKIFLELHGKRGVSKEVLLSVNGFKKGSFIRKKIFAEDVGNIQSIKLSNSGLQQYRCNSIKIESGMNYWNFECNAPITKKKPIELSVVDIITFEITVKTSSLENSGTNEPIYIRLLGTKGKTPEKLLSDKGFEKASLVQVHIDTLNVGSVYGIMLFIKGYDSWKPEEIIVKKPSINLGVEEKIFKVPGNTVLDSPVKPITIKIPLPESENSEEEEKNNSGTNFLLDNKDQQRIIKLACTDVMKDNDQFGPNFVSENVNYMNFLAECPSDCLRAQTRAIGLGIHPEESPICINALVDRAISFYGGIINISIYRGFPSYTGGKKIFGIPVLSFGASKRSYTIAKVDNIDMISKDVRILDFEGRPSFKGRLEIRNEGKWGTICAKDLINTAATIICKEIGYKEGKFLNPPPEKGRKFCANYEGYNYCAPDASEVLFSNLQCQGNEESIMKCYRIMADKTFCNHDYDALIECSNKSDDEVGTFQTGTVRLIDASGNPSQTGIGRLEILKGGWGTVCNTKFTHNSAKIVCKQMGFLDGKMFGDIGAVDMCSNVLGNNLCGDYRQPIKLTEVLCSGYENNIRDCKSKTSTNSCSHFNDVVVKCEGYGDPSGRSQNMRPAKVLSPLIGKLPMVPIYNAKCNTNANRIHFRGDPGSIYLVSCPSGCANERFNVIGSGIYSFSSSICRASIQSGIISDEGGLVLLVKTYGQNKFFGSLLRDITSQDSNYLKVSFFVTSPNSAYMNMISMINDGSSFLELDQNISLNTLPVLFGSHKSRYFSSFIEKGITNSGVPTCDFEWVSPNNDYIFDGKKVYVDLLLSEGSKKVLKFKTFTIFAKLMMTGFNSETQVIFSLGGCEGYSILIDKNSEICVDVRCGKNVYKSGIFIPLSSSIKLGIVYNDSKLIFYLNGKKISEKITYFTLNPESKIALGRHSNFNKWFFKGKMFFIAFFNSPLGVNRNKMLYEKGYPKPQKKRLSKFVTLDSRPCISSCAIQPYPGTPGSPKAPPEALMYQINGENQMINGSGGGSSIEDKLNNDITAMKEISCRITAKALFKKFIKGDKRRIKCPKNCDKVDLNIFGTIIYTLDSSICKSAIHSGILKNKGGLIMIKIVEGMKFYLGSLQYGIQSTGLSGSNYAFTMEYAPPVLTISCLETASNPMFSGPLGKKFLVKCSTNCSKVSHNVFGNEVYSGDSSICQAAIHSGAINDRGGEVNFTILKGQKLYYGKRSYGIESKDRDNYVKSIKFFTSKNKLYVKYLETFSDQTVSKNWNIIDNLDANNYPSKWQYVSSTLTTKNKYILRQSSKIKAKGPYDYGSMILLKKADAVNSIFKINFFFVNMNPVGIIFRYKDENNYYHLRINNLGPYKILFLKKYEGKSTILASSTISITPRLWYSFTLLISFDSFIVNLQIGELRSIQKIFTIKDNDLQRGGLGIATNGNDDFYISSIYVDNYIQSKVSTTELTDKRSFDQILKENNSVHRSKFCKSKFENDKNKVHNCKEFHNYCRIMCDDFIHSRENILNYNCYKSCVKDSLLKKKIENMDFNPDASKISNPKIWIPKDNEKCDYRPEDLVFSSSWTNCFIEKVKQNPNDPEQKIVKIKYFVKTEQKRISILYPSTVLKRCGEIITSRKDC